MRHRDGPARRLGSRRGTTLAIVLWVLLAAAALTVTAALSARLDLALAAAWRDHAAALGLAETGVAEALVALSAGRAAGERAGGVPAASWSVTWEPSPTGVRIEATGVRGAAVRAVEAHAEPTGGGAWTIAAWREVR